MAFTLQEELARAEMLIDRGEQRLRRQRQLIARLSRQGLDTGMARQLLSRFEEVQRLQMETREHLLAELQGAVWRDRERAGGPPLR